ncbi:MAG: tRNA (adenosine(37)-N6)-threonylcarbamoyltransferase complex ATPase subunit type 1 TsaE [Alphaproteobacteria bacterium]|nr:tRNA (adenosine(37)-N6)-threonylcarbamoyltransferase complex ATPase subunit type 1 TsaE [Alphaproteobacteria bacterium]
MDRWSTFCGDAEHTRALGRVLGALCRVRPGDGVVVALDGDLGAGKTTFAQGVGAGLELDGDVVSPTFVLVAEHDGVVPLLHADLYRVDAAGLPGIGLDESLESWPGVALVEWAERFPDVLPDDHLRLSLQIEGAGRAISVQATGPASRGVLARWAAAWAEAGASR